MSKKRSANKPQPNDNKPAGQNRTTIITAIIGLVGTVLVAYIGLMGIRAQTTIPIQATQTAEKVRTQQTPMITNTSTALFTATPPFSTTISGTSLPLVLTQVFNNGSLMRITYAPPQPNGIPRLMPKEIQPDLSFPNNDASERIRQALQSEELKDWPVVPFILYDDEYNSLIELHINVTGLGTNTEWVKLNNQMRISVLAEPVAEHIQLVIVTGFGGIGEDRIASQQVLLSPQYDKFSLDVDFPQGDFFTLEPGELESFIIPLECSAPSIYHVMVEVAYLYQGVSDVVTYAEVPPLICPKMATLWRWEYGSFYAKNEYAWNGESYIELSP